MSKSKESARHRGSGGFFPTKVPGGKAHTWRRSVYSSSFPGTGSALDSQALMTMNIRRAHVFTGERMYP